MTDTSARTMGRKMTIGNGGTSALMAGVAGFGLGMMVSAGRKAASQAATFAAGDWFEGLKAEHQAARTLLEQLAATREEDVAKRAALVLESGQEAQVMQAGARRLALTLARALQLTLLCEHAQWMIDHGGDRRGYAAAMRFARQPVDLMTEVDPAADRLLLG